MSLKIRIANSYIIFVICVLNTLNALPSPPIIKPQMPHSIEAASDGNINDLLVFVQAIWRHGDRTPTSTFPTDEHQEDEWAQGWGQLTPRGMQQHFVLGRKLCSRYIESLKFVSESYKSREIYVRSTNSNRTIMSAISNFVGFYTSKNASNNNDDYPRISGWPANYVPVPIHSNIPTYEDYDANVEAVCKRRDALYNLITETPEYTSLANENQELFNNLSNWTGFANLSLNNMWKINDAIFIEQIYNKTLPDWATPEVVNKLIELDKFADSFQYGGRLQPFRGIDFSKELKVIRGGPLLNTLINTMNFKINCLAQAEQSPSCSWINNLKYSALSAHDSTISGLSSVLGTTSHRYMGIDSNPPYSAAVTVELWRNASSNDYYVKTLFWAPDKEDAEDITTEISGCESGCSLQKFIERSQPFLPLPSIQEICAKVPSTNGTPESTAKSANGSTVCQMSRAISGMWFFTTIINYLIPKSAECV